MYTQEQIVKIVEEAKLEARLAAEKFVHEVFLGRTFPRPNLKHAWPRKSSSKKNFMDVINTRVVLLG